MPSHVLARLMEATREASHALQDAIEAAARGDVQTYDRSLLRHTAAMARVRIIREECSLARAR